MIDEKLLKQKDKILELRTKLKDIGTAGKAQFQKEWFRSILFYVGQQWIRYDKRKKKWEDAEVKKWYPRPVTNKYAAAANTLKTVLTQKEPRAVIRPESDSEEDIASAEIGDSLVEVVDTEAGMKMAREINSSWVTLTGNCFFHQYYYTSEDEMGMIFIPFERCEMCNQVSPPDEIENSYCPMCKQKSKFVKAIDGQGNEIGIEMPKGRLRSDPISGFELFFGQEVENFEDVKQLVRSKRKPTDELKEFYPEFADKIMPESVGEDQSSTYLQAMAYVSNTGGMNYTANSAGSSSQYEMTSVDYVYSLPTTDFPQGLMATILGDEIVELSDMQENTDINGRYFLPFVFCGSNRVSGRFWHKTFLDDLIKKQIQRNKMESFIELQMYRTGANQWLVPTGTNMDNPTGEPGQKIEYTHTVKGEKPELIKGIPPPEIAIRIIEMIDRDFEELAATYDVLKGQLPAGLETFAGLRLLTERAFSRHNELIRNWEYANEKVTKQLIELARKHFTEKRKKTIQNEYGSWETKTFTKADIQGGIDVKVEAGSTIPKSQAVEQSAIFDSLKAGLIDNKNIQVNNKILEKLGQSEFSSHIGLDIKDAMREWKTFLDAVNENKSNPESWALAIRPRKGIDNEMVHYLDASSRAKTEEFFQMPKEAQMLWEEHILYHKMNFEQEQAQQQMISEGQPSRPISRAAAVVQR